LKNVHNVNAVMYSNYVRTKYSEKLAFSSERLKHANDA